MSLGLWAISPIIACILYETLSLLHLLNWTNWFDVEGHFGLIFHIGLIYIRVNWFDLDTIKLIDRSRTSIWLFDCMKCSLDSLEWWRGPIRLGSNLSPRLLELIGFDIFGPWSIRHMPMNHSGQGTPVDTSRLNVEAINPSSWLR